MHFFVKGPCMWKDPVWSASIIQNNQYIEIDQLNSYCCKYYWKSCLPCLTELVIDKAVVAKQLEESMKEKVLEVLLIRHRHQNQKKMTENGGGKLLPTIRSFADIGKKGSFPKSIGNLGMIDSVKNKHLLRFQFFFCNTYTGTILLRHKNLQVRIKWKTCKVLW